MRNDKHSAAIYIFNFTTAVAHVLGLNDKLKVILHVAVL